MKQLTALLLVLALVFSLSACGGKQLKIRAEQDIRLRSTPLPARQCGQPSAHGADEGGSQALCRAAARCLCI